MNRQKTDKHQEILNLVTKIWSELSLCFERDQMCRIRHYLDVLSGLKSAPTNIDGRSFFSRIYVPGLTDSPFISIKGLDEPISPIVMEMIERECHASFDNPDTAIDHSDLLDAGKWSCSYLVREFEASDAAQQRFPVTCYFLNDKRVASEALFSRLGAHGEIPFHSDRANYMITIHLPISACGAKITVKDETRRYVRGVPICFDASFYHSVKNEDCDRDILLFNIWHPSLSNAEVSALSYIRHQWDLSFDFDPDYLYGQHPGGNNE